MAPRIDLQMSFFGVVGPFVIGTTVGLLAGNFGGRADTVLMRILDITVSFPYFVLVIAIVAVLQPGLISYYISLTLVNWVSYARLVRSQVIVLKHADFVLAARTIGLGELRVMTHHLLPNAIAPAVVFVMTDAVLTIVLGSSLGFLGLGVQPPTAEWGVMIAEGQLYLGTAWWISVFPGLAISVLALGFSLVADGLARLLHTAAMSERPPSQRRRPGIEFATDHGPVAALRGVSFAMKRGRGAGHRRRERLGQDGRLPLDHAPAGGECAHRLGAGSASRATTCWPWIRPALAQAARRAHRHDLPEPLDPSRSR